MTPKTHEELRSHFELHEAGHVFSLIERLRLTQLLYRYPLRLVWALYVLFTCFVSIGIIATLAVFTRNPFIFPSLGPTAYLLFFTPLARASSPRHALLGHAIGILFGYLALFATGTLAPGAGLQRGIPWPTILAAAFSLSATGAAMVIIPRQSSSSGRHNSDRVIGSVVETAGTVGDRGSRRVVSRRGTHHQSPGRHFLSLVGISCSAVCSPALRMTLQCGLLRHAGDYRINRSSNLVKIRFGSESPS